jgi:hypothetical protein
VTVSFSNNNLHASTNIIMAIKSRRMTWAGHAAWMGETNAYKILVEKLELKSPLE